MMKSNDEMVYKQRDDKNGKNARWKRSQELECIASRRDCEIGSMENVQTHAAIREPNHTQLGASIPLTLSIEGRRSRKLSGSGTNVLPPALNPISLRASLSASSSISKNDGFLMSDFLVLINS